MLTMMNEARLGVGAQVITKAEIAYQNAVSYAKDRLGGALRAERKTTKVSHILSSSIPMLGGRC